MREYLATGKPIVGVPAPEIERFAGLVRVARGPEQFITEIERALSDDTEADRVRRIEAASIMTWDARVHEVANLVERRIWEKEQIHREDIG